MKKLSALTLGLLSASISIQAIAEDKQKEPLPAPYESVFESSMNDPNVMIYYADKAYQKGDYASATRWMLEAAQYDHPEAIENARYLIKHNLGTQDNREKVIDFLSFYAQPQGDEPAEVFAQLYLADYYRGDKCVWLSPEEKADCAISGGEPLAAKDMKQSYFYYEGAAEQGADRARYSTGMMNILGLGVPRNVPFGLEWLRPLAENGSADVSYLIGMIYQQGYWMPLDRTEASVWFEKAAESKHPGSMLELAKNAEAGVLEGGVEVRTERAIGLYKDVYRSLLSTAEQKAEAAYRLGLIYANHGSVKDTEKAHNIMVNATQFDEPTESTVKAFAWLGNQKEHSDLSMAVLNYKKAIEVLKQLPLEIQQRHSILWEKIAHAYGRGQKGNFDRDERLFAQYMNERRRIMAKTAVPSVKKKEFEGYSAFVFPG